jgi:hypothetical protein
VAWGAVYTAYPGFRIVHHPGCIHSNVNPLSWLPRTLPHNSLVRDNNVTIVLNKRKQNIAQASKDCFSQAPAKEAAFFVFWWEDIIEKSLYAIQTCRQKLEAKEVKHTKGLPVPEMLQVEDPLLLFHEGDHWTYPVGVKPPGDDYQDNWSKKVPLTCLNKSRNYQAICRHL